MTHASETAIDPIIPLDAVDRTDAPRVGTKAANLGDLHAAGFPVPPGIVIAPEADASAVCEALGTLADNPVAVRSSAVGEDLPDASYAGQYDTVLDVRGVEAILAAIERCRASTENTHVQGYRAQRGLDASPMAVIVQQLVIPDAAGVAFTANPITGARGECLVSAVRGLGDRLVSGEAVPDEWVVRGWEVEAAATPEGALSEDQVAKVAAMARAVAEHFGAPQDVEWAVAGEALWVLQARPITALPPERIPIPIEPPEGTWEREASHFPDPPTPLTQEFLPRIIPLIARSMAQYGMLIDGMDFRLIGGNVYQRMIPLGGKEGPSPPSWLLAIVMPVLRRIVPSLRKRISRCIEAVRNDEFQGALEAWLDRDRPALMAATAAHADVDLAALTDRELATRLDTVMDHVAAAFDLHSRFAMAYVVLTGEALLFVERCLGWDDLSILTLCSGTSELSTAPGRAIAALARRTAGLPRVQAVLERAGPDLVQALERVDAEFAKAWQAFQKEYGWRNLSDDLIEPTLAERPDLLASLVLAQMRVGHDPAAVDAKIRADVERLDAQARSVLAGRSKDLATFERLIPRARRAYGAREDNVFHTGAVPGAICRFTALEMGRRLVERGDIEQTDDVFFLFYDELIVALEAPRDWRVLVARRRGEREWAFHSDLPSRFGPPPDESPSMGWMPPEVRLVTEAFLGVVDRTNEPAASGRRQTRDGGIDGIAASGGTYEGVVRVVASEREFHKVAGGDVLVCKATSPAWSILFPYIGALVTDAGGILSHQAIIAREYGIPAVVATGTATRLLRDGQRVRVDGSAGLVEVIG